MPQPKKHANQAERQAEYRARKAKEQPTQAALASLARSIAGGIREAALDPKHENHADAMKFASATHEQTLINLSNHFR